MNIVFPKSSRKYMELQCNSVEDDYTSCPEINVNVASILEKLQPNRALEIGAGLGRVSVYLRNKFDWHTTKFYLLDGNSGEEQIAGLHETVGKSFYNSLSATREYCVVNNISAENLVLLNAESVYSLPMLDICYSFKAIGFHWPMNYYLSKVSPYMISGSYLFFELRDTRRTTYKVEKRWKRIVNFVKRQIDGISVKDYTIIESNTECTRPVIVLKKR